MSKSQGQVHGGPVHVIVMGVSGSGKSTVAQSIADRMGWEFGEGDDHHPKAHLDKMGNGEALTDTDRWPWLRILAGWTKEHHAQGRSTVLTCSALRRDYRDILRAGVPGTVFVHLTGDRDLLLERMEAREHFMPVSLLDSQFDTLEHLQPDENGIAIDVRHPVGLITEKVNAYLG